MKDLAILSPVDGGVGDDEDWALHCGYSAPHIVPGTAEFHKYLMN